MRLTGGLALPGQGALVIAATATPQQTTQGQGMLRVRQPEDGLPVQWVNTLTADSQNRADGRKGLRRVPLKTIVGDEDAL